MAYPCMSLRSRYRRPSERRERDRSARLGGDAAGCTDVWRTIDYGGRCHRDGGPCCLRPSVAPEMPKRAQSGMAGGHHATRCIRELLVLPGGGSSAGTYRRAWTYSDGRSGARACPVCGTCSFQPAGPDVGHGPKADRRRLAPSEGPFVLFNVVIRYGCAGLTEVRGPSDASTRVTCAGQVVRYAGVSGTTSPFTHALTRRPSTPSSARTATGAPPRRVAERWTKPTAIANGPRHAVDIAATVPAAPASPAPSGGWHHALGLPPRRSYHRRPTCRCRAGFLRMVTWSCVRRATSAGADLSGGSAGADLVAGLRRGLVARRRRMRRGPLPDIEGNRRRRRTTWPDAPLRGSLAGGLPGHAVGLGRFQGAGRGLGIPAGWPGPASVCLRRRAGGGRDPELSGIPCDHNGAGCAAAGQSSGVPIFSVYPIGGRGRL